MASQLDAADGCVTIRLGPSSSVYVGGTGDPLLLLHGWGLRPAVYAKALDRLAERGFRVAAPTLAVVGRRWDLDRAVHRAEKVLDHLGWDRAIVVGNSLGGAVATAFAAQHPHRVRALGLVNAVSLPMDRGLLGWVLPFRHYASAGNLRAVSAFVRNAAWGRGVISLAQAGLFATSAALSDEVAVIRGAGVPSVVLWGEADRLLPIDLGRRLARELDAPLRVVPGADHDWTVRRPDMFARELEISVRAALNGRAAGARSTSPERRAAMGTP